MVSKGRLANVQVGELKTHLPRRRTLEQTSDQLGRAAVVVVEPTEDRSSDDYFGVSWGSVGVHRTLTLMGNATNALRGSVMIIKIDVLVDDRLQVTFSEEDDVIQTLITQSTVEAFYESIGVRCVVGRRDPSKTDGAEPAVKMRAHTKDLTICSAKLTKDAVVVVNQEAVRVIKGQTSRSWFFTQKSDGLSVTEALRTRRDPTCNTTKM